MERLSFSLSEQERHSGILAFLISWPIATTLSIEVRMILARVSEPLCLEACQRIASVSAYATCQNNLVGTILP